VPAGPGGASPEGIPVPVPGGISYPQPSPAEQFVITVAGEVRQRCICGGDCEAEGSTPITAETAARLRQYRAQHPGHGFYHYGEAWAVVLDYNPEHPDVQAAPTLDALLDELGVPPAAALS
jgi:hypothetical protein